MYKQLTCCLVPQVSSQPPLANLTRLSRHHNCGAGSHPNNPHIWGVSERHCPPDIFYGSNALPQSPPAGTQGSG